MANYEQRKQEAIRRLELLKNKGLMYDVVRKFKKKKSELYYSDRYGNWGTLFFFNQDGSFPMEWLGMVKQFEDTYNATVYHITHEKCVYTNPLSPYGDEMETLTMFYVSQNEDEWEYDYEDLKNGYAYANVVNLTYGGSEIGSIGYRVSGGGIVRTA